MTNIMSAKSREYRGSSARRMKAGTRAAGGDGRPPGLDGRPATANGAKIFDKQTWAAITRSLDLSNREQQLLRGVFEDATDSCIASNLGISRHTVHTHFERLHQKLGVSNRTKLILRVMDKFLALTALPGSGLLPVCPLRATPGCPWWNSPRVRNAAAAQAGEVQ